MGLPHGDEVEGSSQATGLPRERRAGQRFLRGRPPIGQSSPQNHGGMGQSSEDARLTRLCETVFALAQRYAKPLKAPVQK